MLQNGIHLIIADSLCIAPISLGRMQTSLEMIVVDCTFYIPSLPWIKFVLLILFSFADHDLFERQFINLNDHSYTIIWLFWLPMNEFGE